MKYENAKDVLPPELFEEVRKYASGKLLYFPIAGQRTLWGTKTGNRYRIEQRNREIRELYGNGHTPDELSEKFYLTPESIRNIIYSKKGTNMNLDEILKLYSDNPPLSTERTFFMDEMTEWGDYYYLEDYEVTFPERRICLHIHCYFFTTEARLKEQDMAAEAYIAAGCDVCRIIPNRMGDISMTVSYAGHDCVVFAEECRENTIKSSREAPRGADGRYIYSDELLTLLGKIGEKHLDGKDVPNNIVLFDNFSCCFGKYEDWIAQYTEGDLPNEIRKKQPDLIELYEKINAELRRTREALRPMYAKLPKSVFEFEELFDVLIDKDGHLVSLSNQTDGGEDVCINHFLCESMRRNEVLPKDYAWLAVHDPALNRLRIENVIHSMQVIGKEYTFSEDEITALPLLYKLMLFGVTYYWSLFDYMDDHDKLKEILEYILAEITSEDEIDFGKILAK